MSEILDRLRRLHSLREQKREESGSPGSALSTSSAPATEEESSCAGEFHPTPQTPASLRPNKPQSLAEAVPGATLETEAGTCYVSAHAYPLDLPRGDFALGSILGQPPRILDQLYSVGVQAAEARGAAFDYTQAAFIDTETSGLGTGSCCFMVGVGTFEQLEPGIAPTIQEIDPESADLDAFALRAPSPALLRGNASPSGPDSEPDSRLDSATHFVVRQFFMRHAGEETALLTALAGQLAVYEMTVTFNGRAFDLPLLRSRFRLHRHFLPGDISTPDLLDERRVHLDLLPPARRLWRRRLQSCRLINLEQKILHLYRSEDDVPGHLIPMLYVDFTRNGDARAMRQVFYHNREDIVSMVGIAAHMSTTVVTAHDTTGRTSRRGQASSQAPTAPAADAQAAESQTLHGHEWLSLGQHYVKQNRRDEAVAALQQATQTLANPQDRALALSELASVYKKAGQLQLACETWQLWISSIPGHDPTPYIELAKHCEWQSRDLAQAEMWTGWALHNLHHADARSHHRARIDELEHRLQRIQRKRATVK